MEEFGKALVIEPYVQSVVLAGGALKHGADAALKAEHIPAIAAGEHVFAFAQGEPKGRYALNHVTTSAKKDGGGYRISGRKAVVIGGPQADHLIVVARTGGAERDSDGISLFVVPKNADGVATRDYLTIDGFQASEISFDNVSVGADQKIGEEGAGLALLERVVDEANAALCAEAVGVLRTTHALTHEYVKTRKQFGRAIGEFQVIQHRVVDMFMEVEESASMALYAALKLDGPERAKAVSAAKARIGRAQRFVGQSAIQLHGGMGVTDEMRVSHYFKRATMIDRQFGDSDHHLKRFMAMS